MARPKSLSEPAGHTMVSIPYGNVYHICLVKLLEECAEYLGECKGCPVDAQCSNWFSQISEYHKCRNNCSGITAENFPYLIIQFLKFRDKAREKLHIATRENWRLYRKENNKC